jgi:cellulose synthase/poly-beta-1,6-N-acetylglucosamine synthase-like glycosyltransferase
VVLIPAHNEAASIGETLTSLVDQTYPAERFTVHVVADNCTDATARIAAQAGARVHERHDDSDRGKGPALNWLIQRVLADETGFDVAVFIDADTTVDREFLSAIDRAFVDGAVAVQGYYGVRRAFESVPSSLRFCALAARHHLRPSARCAIGGSCGLFGNGMAFRRELLADRPWRAHLVEDMQFQLDLLFKGVLVRYVPEARVEAEMPNTFAASVTQHQRWEQGRRQIVRQYWPRLVTAIVRGRPMKRVAATDCLADMTLPPLSVLGAGVAMSAVSGAVIHAIAPSRQTRRNALVGAGLVVGLAGHVLAALRLVNAPRAAYVALIRAPQLAAWKIGVMLHLVGNRADGSWVRTSRNAATGTEGTAA